jgi:glutamate racemase
VDSAHAAAHDVWAFLESRGLGNPAGTGKVQLLVTDLPKSFAEIAGRFLGADVSDVEQIDL